MGFLFSSISMRTLQKIWRTIFHTIMETVYSKTPLGIAKICGDEKCMSVISVSNEGFIPSIFLTVR